MSHEAEREFTVPKTLLNPYGLQQSLVAGWERATFPLFCSAKDRPQ